MPGPVHVAGHAEELTARAFLGPEFFVGRGPVLKNEGGGGDAFHVVHGGRHIEDAALGREGRPDAGIALSSFQRADERGFLAADVGPGPGVHVDVELIVRAQGLVSDQALRIGLVHRGLDPEDRLHELAPDVDVGRMGLHGPAGDDDPLDQHMGVLPHDLPVLERPRLPLVRVHAQIARTIVGGHEGPLPAGGETRAPAAPEPRVKHGLGHRLRLHAERLPRGRIPARGLIGRELPRLRLAPVPAQYVIFSAIFQFTIFRFTIDD